jgi:hypothetical protein
MKQWETILGYEEMTAMYRSLPSLENTPFTTTFYRNPRELYGDTVDMINVSATNAPGPMNSRGAAARMIQPKGGSKQSFSIFHKFDELPLDIQALTHLRQMDNPMLQEMGKDVIDLQLELLATQNRLAKEVILASIMVYHRVNIDINGNIRTPSVNATSGAITDASGTVISADFGIPDSHRGNLGGIIAAQWSTAGTSIMDQLETLDRQAGVEGAPRVTDIYVNSLHKADLRANTEFNDWAKYTNVQNYSAQVLSNFQDDTLTVFGKRFHFISGTWEDTWTTPGTTITRDIMPQNYALMVPDFGAWIRPLTGKVYVPTGQGLCSAATPLEDFELRPGEYSYGYSNHNPVRVSVFGGDSFGLGFANNRAVWVGKVFS